MRLRRSGRRGRPGFSLLELVTVVAIMGILMTLMVTGIQGITRGLRVQNTRDLLSALDVALMAYADDYNGLFPWTSTGGKMGEVRSQLKPSPADGDLIEEAILYLALTSRHRHGPYFRGDQRYVLEDENGVRYFADPWRQAIRYQKVPDSNPTVQLPRLLSEGPSPNTDQDNIYNY